VDTAENIERLVQAVDAMIDTGVLALSDVEVIRVQSSSAG
jgi:PII-like signaling protein